MNSTIDNAMKQGVAEGVFPGAQLLVVKGGDVLHHEAYGAATLDTLFDVASLTKVVSTTTIAMLLAQEKRLDLDAPVSFVTKNNWHKEVCFWHLLNHSSGLPAWRPYYEGLHGDMIGTPEGKEYIIDQCLSEPFEYPTGTKSLYSDIGFIILGDAIENMTGKSLGTIFEMKVAAPLKLKNTAYRPLKGENSSNLDVAPTEKCVWRKRMLKGEVHDQNCYAMGGVAAHAGLFSNTNDLKVFCDEIVAAWNGSSTLLSQETMKRFFDFEKKWTTEPSTRLLGWDRPAEVDSQAGSRFSKRTVGHLGFTGCSIWIDLEKNFYVVLLANRIHPDVANEKIKAFRPVLHDLVFETLIK